MQAFERVLLQSRLLLWFKAVSIFACRVYALGDEFAGAPKKRMRVLLLTGNGLCELKGIVIPGSTTSGCILSREA
jgi:hypothetical protein